MGNLPGNQIDTGIFICATPINATTLPLDAADFAALTWVEIGHVGASGDWGETTNITNYNTFRQGVTINSKGYTSAGRPSLEVGRDYSDAGQVALRAAALTKFNYAFKKELSDAPSASHTNTIIYNVGIVTGPGRPENTGEDFVREVFPLAFNQRSVVVNPAASGG